TSPTPTYTRSISLSVPSPFPVCPLMWLSLCPSPVLDMPWDAARETSHVGARNAMTGRNLLTALGIFVLGGALVAANLWFRSTPGVLVTVEQVKTRDLE